MIQPPASLKPQHLVLLLAYLAAIFLFNLGGARSLTPHELNVGEGAREMIALHDWIVPRLLNLPWLEKPPLAHWAVSAAFLIGGISETAARLPSVICATIGIVLIARLAAAWYGSAIGLLTGLVQASTVYAITYARLAEADIYLWSIVVGCIYLFAIEQVGPAPRPPRTWRRLLFWILIGLTQYAKGPLFGAVMALVPCVLFAALAGDRTRWRWFFFWPGIAIGAIIALAWPATILLKYPDAAHLWYLHTFARLGGDEVLNPEKWWLYFETAPWQILPWTPLVLGAIAPTLKAAWHERASVDRFLWLWFAGLFILLSIPSARHHHYLIYALPPFSFWTARMFAPAAHWVRDALAGRWRLAILAVATAALSVAGVMVAQRLFPNAVDEIPWMATILWLTTVVVAGLCAHEMWDRSAAALFLGLIAMFTLVHQFTMPRLDRQGADTDMLRRLHARLASQDQVISTGGDPRRQWFYLERDVKVGAEAAALLTTPGVYVISEIKAPVAMPPAIKLERIDQGSMIKVDRIVR